MSALMATLIAVLPNAFMAVLGRLVTEAFLTRVIAKVTVYGLRKAAKMTTNTVDDEIVDDIAKRLGEEWS